MKVTDRDLRILTWIGEQFIVNARELDRLLCFDAHTHHLNPIGEYFGRNLVLRWKRAGLVQTVYQLRRGLHVFLTAKGLRLANLPYAPKTPSVTDVGHLTHHDGINQVRLYLERQAWDQGQVMSWVSERTLMQRQKLYVADHPEQTAPHRPDGELYLGEQCIAIEVEKTYKRPQHMQRILHDYLFTSHYITVWYYCETLSIQQSVTRAIHALLDDLPSEEIHHLEQKVVPHLMPRYA